MKNFLKILFIFVVMLLALFIEPNDLQAKDFQSIASIQAISKEQVEIVSNNFYGGEVYASEEENNQNLSGNSSQVIAFNLIDNSFIKNKTHINGCFIHNLSTSKQKVQQIRAP